MSLKWIKTNYLIINQTKTSLHKEEIFFSFIINHNPKHNLSPFFGSLHDPFSEKCRKTPAISVAKRHPYTEPLYLQKICQIKSKSRY